MRVSREKAQENRELVIETAARLLRERGFEGIGIADIMEAAGLTHGGFYRNFASKDDLATLASARAAETMKATMIARLGQSPGEPFRALVEHYISRAHHDDRGSGCILPAHLQMPRGSRKL
ncbi:TetR/AcrR family transcriptional regulator [Pararhizobium sp. LjRoot238]|uniref:TetR/AcrR family transcriptional regulator n=1 Tax=Pararhizobium sp. LjRoot238 TaxID=3342293 RepID=UPI003ECEC9A4